MNLVKYTVKYTGKLHNNKKYTPIYLVMDPN